ncbi:hypothetical protein H0N99_00635 [Candidatus Micrarchaeota archaeon]|nr:hypothetical protein [Candidatus Micrarchaeota archaeon]
MDLAIWINGNEKLGRELEKIVSALEAEKERLEDEASRFHKKKVGSREYWYASGGRSGVWRYVCPAKRNPADGIEKKIEALIRKKERIREGVNRAVIKPLGKHLLIDLDRFKPSDGEVISSLELYEALKELKK